MSTVTLVGAFGQGNPGDEALCAAFCEALAEHDVIVVSGDPGDTARRHRVRAVPATALSTARSCARRPTPSSSAAARSSSRCTPPPAGAPNALLRNTAALVAGARARGTKVAMIGVGADDLRGRQAQAIARWLVRHSRPARAARRGVGGRARRRRRAGAVLDRRRPGVAAGARHGRRSSRSPAASRRSPSPSATSPATRRVRRATWRPRSRRSGDRYSVHLQPWQIGAGGRDLELAEQLRERLGADAKVLDAPASLGAAVASFVGDRPRRRAALPRPRRRRHGRHPLRRRGPRAEARRARPGGSARCRCRRTPRPRCSTGAIRHALGHPPVAAAAVAAEVAGAERIVRHAASCCCPAASPTSPSSSPACRSPTGRVGGEGAPMTTSPSGAGWRPCT